MSAQFDDALDDETIADSVIQEGFESLEETDVEYYDSEDERELAAEDHGVDDEDWEIAEKG